MKNFYLLIAIVLLANNAFAQCGTAISSTNTICNGSCDGSITFTPSSGTSPYHLTINGGPVISFASSYTLTNLCPWTYHYVLTDTLSSCTDSGDVTITGINILTTVITFTNATCTGGNDGSACVVTSGGIPPYTYWWAMSGDTTSCDSGLSPGPAICFISDSNNCWDSVGVIIGQSVLLNVTSITHVSCNGANDGDFCVSASGGVSPYLYSIDGGVTNQASNCFTNLTAGNYTVTATDSNGCVGNIAINIIQPPPFSINFTSISNVTCNGYADGSVCVNTNGGGAPYIYLWSTGDSVDCITGLPAGQVSVSVWELTGCVVTDSIIITEPQPLSAGIASIAPSCGLCDGIAFAIVSGGTPGYMYQWSPTGDTVSSITNLCAGTHMVTVTDTNGCVDIHTINLISAQCDSVWPGDANYDGIADNNDVLSLGMNYGFTGPIRPGGNNSWTGQVCANWSDTLPNGVNGKHSDCDGNGIINDADTLPIFLNYGFLHARRSQLAYNASLPDLTLDAVVDTAGPNQLLHVKIHMGSPGTPVPEIYGVAFTLTFDPALVDTTTASFDFSTSGLGVQNVDLLTFQYPFYSSGAIDVALTRTDHVNVSQVDTLIAVFDVVITDNVSTVDLLRFNLSNVTAITYAGDVIVMNAVADSVVIDPDFVGIRVTGPEHVISVFPLPASDHLNLVSPVEIERAELINEFGVTIVAKKIHQKTFSLDMNGIKNGMYFLQLTTRAGVVRKRICVLK